MSGYSLLRLAPEVITESLSHRGCSETLSHVGAVEVQGGWREGQWVGSPMGGATSWSMVAAGHHAAGLKLSTSQVLSSLIDMHYLLCWSMYCCIKPESQKRNFTVHRTQNSRDKLRTYIGLSFVLPMIKICYAVIYGVQLLDSDKFWKTNKTTIPITWVVISTCGPKKTSLAPLVGSLHSEWHTDGASQAFWSKGNKCVLSQSPISQLLLWFCFVRLRQRDVGTNSTVVSALIHTHFLPALSAAQGNSNTCPVM